MNKNLVGRCGIYCGSCIIYRAYKDSEQLRQRVAERENCEPKHVQCEGCQRVLTTGWDKDKQWGKNCRIMRCLETKGLVFCYDCDIYPNCEKFGDLANHLLKYSESLTENLKKIKEGKIEEWLKEEEEKWRCHECGKAISRHLKECHWCGKNLKNYDREE